MIPGEATIEIDIRTLPGTTPDDIREEIVARLGDLAPHCELEQIHRTISVEAPVDGELYGAPVRRDPRPRSRTASRSR